MKIDYELPEMLETLFQTTVNEEPVTNHIDIYHQYTEFVETHFSDCSIDDRNNIFLELMVIIEDYERLAFLKGFEACKQLLK